MTEFYDVLDLLELYTNYFLNFILVLLGDLAHWMSRIFYFQN